MKSEDKTIKEIKQYLLNRIDGCSSEEAPLFANAYSTLVGAELTEIQVEDQRKLYSDMWAAEKQEEVKQ